MYSKFTRLRLVLLLTIISVVVTAQTSNTWVGGSSGNWNVPGNWSTGNVPSSTDKVVINTNTTITTDFTSGLNIGQLEISGTNTTVTFLADANNKALSIGNGYSGTDFFVATGCTLTFSATASNLEIQGSLVSNNTGQVDGNLVFGSNASFTFQQHTLTVPAQSNALIFSSGSSFTADVVQHTNPFGSTAATGNDNVVFQSGSIYTFKGTSGNPFAATAPASVTKFESGSLYRHQATPAPAISGRTYADFEFDINNTILISLTSVSESNFNNFTFKQGLLRLGASGSSTSTYSINGNLDVQGGTLTIGGASSGTTNNVVLNLKGVNKTIVGTGTLTLSSSAAAPNTSLTINLAAGASYTLNRAFDLSASPTSNKLFNISGNLTIGAAGTLTTGGSGVTVIKSTASNTGAIINSAGGTITGDIAIERYIIGQRGWRMFAYPFTTTQTFSSLASTNGIAISTTPSGASGLTDVRSFTNGTTNGWNNVIASSTTANTPFALFIRGLSSEVTGLNYTAGPSAFTFSVNGTLNASPFTVTPSASNFTLVGNPFAAPVNSSALTNGTGKSYYVYQISQGGNLTAQRTKAGAWSTVLSSSATTPIPTLGVIAYQAGSASSYNISTSDINTTNAAATGLFSTEKAIEHLELRVLQNGMQLDNLFVRQDAASSEKGTDGKDLQKLANEGLNVYTIAKADNIKLAVDARNLVETTTIPLGVVGAVGNYQLQVANLNMEGVNVSLKDAFTNTTTALKANSNYEFAITTDATSKGENRFELVLNKVASNMVGVDVANAGKMTAKLLNGNINRNNVAQLEITGAAGKVEIRVTDMAGRLLHTQAGQNGRNTIQLGRKAGVQLITISDGTTTINQKMVKQ